MADCFRLPNAEELVERVRAIARVFYEDDSILYPAANAIEQFAKDIDVLTKENARLKAERDHWEEIARERGEHYRQMRRERDAAVEDLKQSAEKEVHNNIQENPCIGCNNGWGSISAEKVTSCVESCAEYKLYCKRQSQPPKEEEDAEE